MYDREKIDAFENILGYSFQNKNFIIQALTHSSYSNEKKMSRLASNERLEFLGDAVLELVTSEFLFYRDLNMSEGNLTKFRASLVCEQTLSLCAREIGLGNYLLLGKGEDNTGGRERDSILSDTTEAIIGAIYLDGGLKYAKEFIEHFILFDIDNKKLFFDSKTILQEIVQNQYKMAVHYELISEDGPDHNKKFTVKVFMGEKALCSGTGKTKKAAEQSAAYFAILKLRK